MWTAENDKMIAPTAERVAAQLRMPHWPFVVVHGYWNSSRVAAARAELTKALSDCHEKNEDGGDLRRLGLSAATHPNAAALAHDAYLQRSAAAYLRSRHFNVKVQAGLARTGQASGGGWHKDTCARQQSVSNSNKDL